MILLFADHCCLGDEKRSGASVPYSLSVVFAAVAGFERDVKSGMVVFVLPAYEAYVVKGVSLRMGQSRKPVDVDSSAVSMLGA